MSPIANFRVVNPEPKDPLQEFVAAGRGAVVSRSSAHARGLSLEVAAHLARTTSCTLAIIDSPAMKPQLSAQLTAALPLMWQFIDPRRLDTMPLTTDNIVILANTAVAPPQSPRGRTMLELIRRNPFVVVMTRPHDMQSSELVAALGQSAVLLDTHDRPARGRSPHAAGIRNSADGANGAAVQPDSRGSGRRSRHRRLFRAPRTADQADDSWIGAPA